MASPSLPAALLLLSFSLFATGAVGRPCKTFLISYTVSSASFSGSTLEISTAGDQVPPRFFAFYRVIPLRYYPDLPYSSSSAGATEPLATTLRLPAEIQRPALPRPEGHSERALGVNSVRERARDVLVVVAGLLFGVGCGALTSATMYLACYLFSNRGEVCRSRGYDYLDDEDVEDDVESPKKRGNTDIPAAPATPVSPLKEGERCSGDMLGRLGRTASPWGVVVGCPSEVDGPLGILRWALCLRRLLGAVMGQSHPSSEHVLGVGEEVIFGVGVCSCAGEPRQREMRRGRDVG
ncbi:hypothetical protein Taro_023318 [Colocasia esculenta]|uniref:Uncharacterized protein n=1 Tax=Colocasia esculenta TaxID=4460 RepID=A0A843V7Z5_COLES|nr:hypothetical protein [Colocasia esculenta]